MADFYMQAQKENSESILLRHARRRRIAKWVLLGALLYCVILDILHFIFPESPTVYYLRPFSGMNTIPASYPAMRYVMGLFSLLPLLGWILLHCGIRWGKALIVIPYGAAWICVCTFILLHSVFAMRLYSLPLLRTALHDALPFLPFGIGVPCLTHLWQKK